MQPNEPAEQGPERGGRAGAAARGPKSEKAYDRYIGAVQAGLIGNYEPMQEIIERALF